MGSTSGTRLRSDRLLLVALALVVGGAVGNLIDRVSSGAVTDFIDVYVGTHHWPSFNVADSAISIGIVLMAIDSLPRPGAVRNRSRELTLDGRAPGGRPGERLDRHLAAQRSSVARNQVQRWIRDGRVRVGRRRSQALRTPSPAGSAIDCTPGAEADRQTGCSPRRAICGLLHEDDDLVVLDKPAGLTVHPGAGRTTGTLAHHLLARYPEMAGVGGPGRPGIVHRLDQGTSGVAAWWRARRPPTTRLTRAFAAPRGATRRYLAIVYGAPRPACRHHRRARSAAIAESARRWPCGQRTAGRARTGYSTPAPSAPASRWWRSTWRPAARTRSACT